MLAQLLVHAVWAGAVATALAYGLALRRQEFLIPARWSFRLVAAGVVLLFGVLLWRVLAHDFRFTYIWGHSSTQLPLHLLIASTYAGQEGSLLLWTFWVALIGIAFQQYARRKGIEAEAMSVYTGVLAGMLLLVVAKNPFTYVWETYAVQGVAPGFTPAQGRGLNPLLHNYWIVVHPPTLFLGFALGTTVFALAVVGLWRRLYREWIGIAYPWILASAAVLGAGIMLGGLWAYETLGWGGFWAWDPVENSSLVPWLFLVALLHTGLVQRRSGVLLRTNAVLAMLAFLSTLYSTFLTRSGVLGDTSVHSFVDPGFFAYTLLIALMGSVAAVGALLLALRWKELRRESMLLEPDSREGALMLGVLGLLASAVVVLVGTSWPILLELLQRPKVAVEQRFYNLLHLPIGAWILLLNGLSLLLHWKATPRKLLWRRLWLPLGGTLLATALTWVGGVHSAELLLLGTAAWFALLVNAQVLLRRIWKRPASAGAYVAHLGFALLVLGVVGMSALSWSQHVRLPQGEPVQLGRYRLVYVGKEQIERQYTDREKWRYHVRVESGGQRFTVAPVLYWSDYNQRQSAFLEPGIAWRLSADIYTAPRAVETEGGTELLLRRGELGRLPGDSLQVELLRFHMGQAMPEGDTVQLGVSLRIVRADRSDTVLLWTRMYAPAQQFLPEWQTLPGTALRVGVMQIVPDRQDLARSQVLLRFEDPGAPQREVLTIEFSVKPAVNLVWLGSALMVLGLLWSGVLRWRNAAREYARNGQMRRARAEVVGPTEPSL
jgi:cytochrome c-type biogenesis protein CcmF